MCRTQIAQDSSCEEGARWRFRSVTSASSIIRNARRTNGLPMLTATGAASPRAKVMGGASVKTASTVSVASAPLHADAAASTRQ